jgi:hypothetical protein
VFFAISSSAQQFAKNEITLATNVQTYGQLTYAPVAGTPFCNPATNHYAYFSTPSFIYTRNLSPSLAIVGTFQPTHRSSTRTPSAPVERLSRLAA